MENSAVRLIAHGRVQGVGFRFFVRGQAATLGVKGWVKNVVDGSVEIHAEASRQKLDLFIERVKKGPTFGRVDDLSILSTETSNDYVSFSIEF